MTPEQKEKLKRYLQDRPLTKEESAYIKYRLDEQYRELDKCRVNAPAMFVLGVVCSPLLLVAVVVIQKVFHL